MQRNGPYAIGIDIGGTKIAVALVNSAGKLCCSKKILTDLCLCEDELLTKIADIVNELIQSVQHEVLGIGLAAPGYVNPNSGIVEHAVNLNWKQVPVVHKLKRYLKYDLPVFLQRDTVAETLGEYYYGAAQDCNDFIFLSIGTGLGAGGFSSGRLITGVNNLALEIGHLSLDLDGQKCNCGNKGCIETLLSGNGLMRNASQLLGLSDENTSEEPGANLAQKLLKEFVETNDPNGIFLIQQVSKALGITCAILKTVLDPERIIIGGGLGRELFNVLVDRAKEEMQARTLAVNQKGIQFYKSSVESSAMGAAAMVWYFNNIDPKPQQFAE